MFQDFVKQIENELANHHDVTSFVPLLRNHMRAALANDIFIYECIERALSTIENAQNKNQWVSPPIYHNPEKYIAVRLIPWPAFYRNNPHQHKTWSVTGVFYNSLDVFTYELVSENPLQLQKERNIAASQHEAGYIMPERIHSVGNPSSKTSISLHIFNNLPGIKSAEENAIWYPTANKDNLKEGLLTRALLAFADCVSELSLANKFTLLKRIFTLGDIEVKLRVIKIALTQAPELADTLYQHIKVHIHEEILQ